MFGGATVDATNGIRATTSSSRSSFTAAATNTTTPPVMAVCSAAPIPGLLRHRHSMQSSLRHDSRHLRFRLDSDDANDIASGTAAGRGCKPRGEGAADRGHRHRYHHSLRLLDTYLWPEQRPWSSPNHHRAPRAWSRAKSPVKNGAKCTWPSPEEPCPSMDNLAPSMAMTRDEFESLPPTIQRKYFSTLERLRFAQSPPGGPPHPAPESKAAHRRSASATREVETRPPPLKLVFGSEELDGAPHRRSQPCHGPFRVYSAPNPGLANKHQQGAEQPTPPHCRQSVILDAADEACLRIGRQRSQLLKPEGLLDQPRHPLPAAKMDPATTEETGKRKAAGLNKTGDSIYDSFRWLEEEDDLDLRLYLDDYHFNLRQEVPVPTKNWRPSFRRHLSITKLPFGRSSVSTSRPATKEANVGPTFASSPAAPAPGSPGHHVRRRSRALSLISPTRQAAVPDLPLFVDAAASHYQDPDARMKLRVYLASPHKFDEAIEFGFPSIDEVQGCEKGPGPGPGQDEAKLGTFLEDDLSSLYSEASAAESESPRTPEAPEKPMAARAGRASQDPGPGPSQGQVQGLKADYAQAPASSREMTLRMTLTRQDLRAAEDQMYGWQRLPAGRRSQATSRDEAAWDCSPKESIERQLAAMDQELLAADNGVVKRLWNRVRRA